VTPPQQPSRRSALAACAAFLAVGSAVRWLPGGNDLWLDEIWSWTTAQALGSPLEVFTGIHHSNNNHLNTLWLWAVGESSHRIYRLPALLAGPASIALAAALAWRRDRLEACAAALGVSACFALIHFSSEARGYAPAVALALGALWCLDREAEAPRAAALGFGVCTALGLLFHLIFLSFWAGALVGSAWHLRRAGPRAALARLARLHALPAAVLAALTWVDLRRFELAGGNPTDPAALVARTVGFALGLPVAPALAPAYALLAAALVGGGLWLLWRERDERWLLHAVAIAVAPLAAIAVLRPQVVAVRYFLIGIALALLLAARLLARAWRAGGAARVVALALLAVYLVGNAVHTARFLALGRGGYRAALHFMAEQTQGPLIHVASDHDFRTGLVLRFYARELPPERGLDYQPREHRAPDGPEWWIRHRGARPAAPAAFLRDADGHRYRLAAEFDHAAISGFYWAVYRRADAGGP
jgi:hypothetical protein